MTASGTGTCAEQCWEAREMVCKCSCDGRNHGITRKNAQAGQQPDRTRRIKDEVFKLVAVVPTANEAPAYIKETGQFYYYISVRQATRRHTELCRNIGRKDFGLGYERATGGALKWPEVKAIVTAAQEAEVKAVQENGGTRTRRIEPFLIWQRIDVKAVAG